MDTSLDGRLALVTGGASGIGRATVDVLVAGGARVAVLDIDEGALGAISREHGHAVVPVTTDFRAADSVEAALASALLQLGGLDILVNNVGAGAANTFDELTDEIWYATLELNFMSYVRAIRAALPALRESRHGVIVNNASDLARQPEAIPADYAASKAAVLAITKSLARSEGPRLRVNAVAPGPIWTPFWSKPGGFADGLAAVHGMEPQAAVEHEMKLRQLPLERLGTPDEVANVIAFLCTDAAAFVTGSVWGVDGGSIRSLI